MSGIHLQFVAGVKPLTATVAPATTSGYGGVPNATITASNGRTPYTYAWTYVSGNSFTLSAPTAATTYFSGAPGSGTYRGTVTDANGRTASGTVDVTIYAFPGGGIQP